jgi:hypothetical protein
VLELGGGDLLYLVGILDGAQPLMGCFDRLDGPQIQTIVIEQWHLMGLPGLHHGIGVAPAKPNHHRDGVVLNDLKSEDLLIEASGLL